MLQYTHFLYFVHIFTKQLFNVVMLFIQIMGHLYEQKRSVVVIIMYVLLGIVYRAPITQCHSHSKSVCSDLKNGISYEHTTHIATSLTVHKSFQNIGFVKCQTNCLRHTVCESVSYDVITMTCNLNSVSMEVNYDPSQSFTYINRSSISNNTQVYIY